MHKDLLFQKKFICIITVTWEMCQPYPHFPTFICETYRKCLVSLIIFNVVYPAVHFHNLYILGIRTCKVTSGYASSGLAQHDDASRGCLRGNASCGGRVINQKVMVGRRTQVGLAVHGGNNGGLVQVQP